MKRKRPALYFSVNENSKEIMLRYPCGTVRWVGIWEFIKLAFSFEYYLEQVECKQYQQRLSDDTAGFTRQSNSERHYRAI